MADRIADLRVLDQLGLAGGARGEVDEHRIVDGGPGRERTGRLGVRRVGVGVPARDRPADHDAGEFTGHPVELRGVGGVGDHDAGPAATDPVREVIGSERAGGRHDDGPELGHRQHRLPQLHLVAEHQDDAVALRDAEPCQPGRHPVGALRHLGERHPSLGAVLLDDPQREPARGGRVAGDDVEPVGRPVERAGQLRPREGIDGLVVVADQRDELVTGAAVEIGVGPHDR